MILDRLRATRLILALGVAIRAVAWGAVASLSIGVAAAVVDQRHALSVGARQGVAILALAAFVAVALALIWRDRPVASMRRVALWVEEQDPTLEYRLVTAVESGAHSLVSASEAVAWPKVAGRRAVTALRWPAAAFAAVFVALLLLPGGAVARISSPRPGDALDGATHPANGSRLTPLVADLVPPRYSGAKPSSIDEPADVRALVGTRLTLRGPGGAEGVVVANGADSLSATEGERGWSIATVVGGKPVALRLSDGARTRIVAVEPIADAAPTVTLAAPARDSVIRTPRGRIALSADATDDIGLSSAAFEVIVSSGEGESFTFKSGTLGATRPKGREARIAASLSLDSLKLNPGDIVHLRAVARDANDVSGPGIGTSDTRTLRIARADEYDSVAVDAAPAGDADKSVVSERMLIMLAEALQAKRPSLARDAFVKESRTIAADQKTLRRSVGEIVFTRLGGDPSGEEHANDDTPQRARTMAELLARADSATGARPAITDFEGGESPVVAVNKPLLEAYNAMWDASGALEIGEPARALPHMRLALAAIQRARQAERLYLRGRPPQVVVDVAKARLQGKEKGSSSRRRALSSDEAATQARADRFARIVELAGRDAPAAADSLLLLRIDALTDGPAFAAALGDAATAIRRGRADDATSALALARRLLAGPPVRRDSLARWGVVP